MDDFKEQKPLSPEEKKALIKELYGPNGELRDLAHLRSDYHEIYPDELRVIQPSEDDIQKLEDHLYKTDPNLNDLKTLKDIDDGFDLIGSPKGLYRQGRQEIFHHHTYDLIKKKDQEIQKLENKIKKLKEDLEWALDEIEVNICEGEECPYWKTNVDQIREKHGIFETEG